MKKLDENPMLEEVQKEFANDKFAFEVTGCRIIEAYLGHASAEMEITDKHRNAMKHVMGGAIFTVADYALAVACNVGQDPTVAISNTIEFFDTPRGTKLVATADYDRTGRNVAFFTVDVIDDLGTKVARMVATCMRVKH